jgi:hypothetical protein
LHLLKLPLILPSVLLLLKLLLIIPSVLLLLPLNFLLLSIRALTMRPLLLLRVSLQNKSIRENKLRGNCSRNYEEKLLML